jgi:hypothetical protein
MPQTSEYAQTSTRSWTTRRDEKRRRMQLVQPWMKGPILSKEKIVDALQWHSYTPFGSFNTCLKSYPLPITSHKPTYRYESGQVSSNPILLANFRIADHSPTTRSSARNAVS